MQVKIRIITSDYELGLDLVESTRFPERRPIIVPGEAIISSQSMAAVDESVDSDDIIDIGVDINEDTSIETFASWLYGKLATRKDKIRLLTIDEAQVGIDEAQVLRAIEDGTKGL